MPELPEVETTRRGLLPHIRGKTIDSVAIRQRQLRWPVPENLEQCLYKQQLLNLQRRAKYLLFHFEKGCLLIHLGMSGSLRILKSQQTPQQHDHIDFVFHPETILRYTDPRRFGAVLWLGHAPEQHRLLKNLGPEPLGDTLTGHYLHDISRNRKTPIKSLLMDQRIVTGIGNIYANEALFKAAIRPTTAAGRLSLKRCQRLATSIQQTLYQAIEQGGTTLRDFVGSDGKPGYFQQHLHVYGRGGLPCTQCGKVLQQIKLTGRSTVFCSHCQR